MSKKLIEDIKRIKSISDLGLLYCQNDYERERHTELRDIAIRMLSEVGHIPLEQLHTMISISPDYPTAKVDIRGMLVNEHNEVLLVKERDGLWSLPGGWADTGFTPSEIVMKEFKEETGIAVTPTKLLAVFDKKMHDHPSNLHYVYKLIFQCKAESQALKPGFDLLDASFFLLNDLPPLSEDRILKTQIGICHQVMLDNKPTYFD